MTFPRQFQYVRGRGGLAWNSIGAGWDIVACLTAIMAMKAVYPFNNAFCALWVLLIGPVAQYAVMAPILLDVEGTDPVAKIVFQNMLSLQGFALEFIPPLVAALMHIASAWLVSRNWPRSIQPCKGSQ